jgi:hypothetical protein
MVWTGGLLEDFKIREISMAGSQPDIASTLLSQLNMNDSEFSFSRNLFDNTKKGFVYCAFRNGNIFLAQKDNELIPNNLFGNLYQQKVYQSFYLNKLPLKK